MKVKMFGCWFPLCFFVSVSVLSPSVSSCLPSLFVLVRDCLISVFLCLQSCDPSCCSLCPSRVRPFPFIFHPSCLPPFCVCLSPLFSFFFPSLGLICLLFFLFAFFVELMHRSCGRGMLYALDVERFVAGARET